MSFQVKLPLEGVVDRLDQLADLLADQEAEGEGVVTSPGAGPATPLPVEKLKNGVCGVTGVRPSGRAVGNAGDRVDDPMAPVVDGDLQARSRPQ